MENILKCLKSYRLFLVTLINIITISAILFISGDKSAIDPVVIFPFTFIAVVLIYKYLKISLNYSIWPYICMQCLLVLVFIDSKLIALTGVSFKVYGVIFALSFATSIYYLFKNVNYLWKNYLIFRSFSIFFLINFFFYYFFYYSDYRTWATPYFNSISYIARDMKSLAIQTKALFPAAGQFSETAFIGKYMGSIVPLIALIIPLSIFKKVNSYEETYKLLNKIVKIITMVIFWYLIASFLSIPLKLSSYAVLFDGRLWGDFLGISGFSEYYLSLYIILLLGFKFYINNNNVSNKNFLNPLMNFSILSFIILLILFIVKTTLLSLSLSIFVMFLFNYRNNIKFKIPKLLIVFVSMLIIIAGIKYSANISEIVDKVTLRFTNGESLNLRFEVWNGYIQYWLHDLNLFNFIFGHGIDSSREVAFNVAFINPLYGVLAIPHVHNFYLELFYDYGMVALFYIGTLLLIGVDNIKNVFNPLAGKNLKLFSCISVVLLLYTSIYYMSEVFRIPAAIVFFSAIGILEALKCKFKILSERETSDVINEKDY